MSLTITPLSASVGALVEGIDLERDVSDAVLNEIVAAWRSHLVLLFRGQNVGDDRLVAFARRFGLLDLAPYIDAKTAHPTGYPEITVVSNVVENGAAIGSLGHSELVWHSDMTYKAAPPVGCVLHAWETPKGVGATWFTNLRAALAALPSDVRVRLRGLELFHDKTLTSAGTRREGLVNEMGVRHPVVISHPSWGEETLLLGRRQNSYLPGLDEPEGDALLDLLWQYATREDFSLRHVWQPGDVVIWDNLLTMHRRDAFPARSRRVLHRAQIASLHPRHMAA